MATTRVRGGNILRRALALARTTQGAERVLAGFFNTARYPDGTPVAAVAAWNEFGTGTIPERPFMRQALKAVEPEVRKIIAQEINSLTLQVDDQLANKIGAIIVGAIQKRIVDLRSPINADSTVARKGSSNPLIDTGTMRTAATWTVE